MSTYVIKMWEIHNICVIDECIFNGSEQLEVLKAEIVVVISSEIYASCKICNAKVLELSANIAVCGKCTQT